MTAFAADLDDDGWPDIYVAADSTAAILYRNNRDGTFTDVAVESGTAYNEHGNPQAGMGVAVGDYRQRRPARPAQDAFRGRHSGALPQSREGACSRTSPRPPASASRTGYVEWGAGMPDLDNDGLAGSCSTSPATSIRRSSAACRSIRTAARASSSATSEPARFDDVTAESGAGATAPHSSRGAAFGDVDNDGDIDVLVMNMNEPPSLLRNDYAGGQYVAEPEARRARPRTDPRSAPRSPCQLAARRQARAVVSQSSYYSHDDLRLHFGLGTMTAADAIEIRWPSGVTQVLTNVRAAQVAHASRNRSFTSTALTGTALPERSEAASWNAACKRRSVRLFTRVALTPQLRCDTMLCAARVRPIDSGGAVWNVLLVRACPPRFAASLPSLL